MSLDGRIEEVAKQLRAGGAVAVLGAGVSRPAGLPMSSQLAPLVWQALDENLVVRAEVASALGRPDDRAKALVDDDGARLAAAYDALRRQPAARRSFQRAFAARDRSIRERSVAHEALAKLFHHGTVELVISVNWDTQLERSYESLYRCRRTLADGLWKIHGDADQPDQDWILPGDAGHVPPELLAEIEALVRDRPRVLLIVGYSESDKRIVEALTRPLAARWVVCRVGPAVTGSLDLRGTAEQILPQLAKRLVPEAEMPGWQFVGQGKLRGLRRALLGMPLKMADARACPPLPEVAQVVARLRAGYSARLVGPPGSGKSLGARQALGELSALGYEIVTPDQPLGEEAERALAGMRFPLAVLIDDAHLVPAGVLQRLEDMASSRLLVLQVATEQGTAPSQRGSIRIDPRRAVRVIADGLLTNPHRTLEAVRDVDDRVGDGWLAERLEERIAEAERIAEVPWQFCFILGGGWRRAGQAADAARAAGADLVLAAAAVRQLVSRDAPGEPESVRAVTGGLVSEDDFAAAVRWLEHERLVLSASDLRCPHQRQAMVVLDRLYEGLYLTPARRGHFLAVCRNGLSDPAAPLLGVHVLLQGLRLSDHIRWAGAEIVTPETESLLVARCVAARTSEQRMAAALVLRELDPFARDWPRRVLAPHVGTLALWIAEADGRSAIGLAWLINDLFNRDRAFAREVCEQVDGRVLGEAMSAVPAADGWAIGELLERLRAAAPDDWRAELVAAFDEEALLSKAEGWPENELEALGHLAAGIGVFSYDLGLSMLERAEPLLRRRLANAPLASFEEVKHIFWKFLRVWDRLGIGMGVFQPSARAKALGRSLWRDVDPAVLGRSIASTSRDQVQTCADLLACLAAVAPRLRKRAVAAVDIERLEPLFERHWQELPHDMMALAWMLRSGADHEPAATWVRRHAHSIRTMATRLAALLPSVAVEVVSRGGQIAFDEAMTFDWLRVVLVIDYVARERPDLVEPLMAPHIGRAAEALGRDRADMYDDVDAFVSVLAEHAPRVLSLILDAVAPGTAEAAWAACFHDSATARRSAARLVEAALAHGGEIGEMARRLRDRYPKASLPAAKLSVELIAPGPARRRRRRTAPAA